MDTYTIHIELEHYVGDRLSTDTKEAFRRLYFRAVSRFSGQELAEYLQILRRYAVAYASVSHTLKRPFRHMESPLFFSSLILFVTGIIVMVSGEFSAFVACGTSASIVGMVHCLRRFIELRRLYGTQELLYRELAETLLQELSLDEGKPA